MKPTLTQIQEEFDEKFLSKSNEIPIQQINQLRIFLTQSNLRVLEKVREMVESARKETRKDGVLMEVVWGENKYPNTVGDLDAMCSENRNVGYNEALNDLLSDLSTLIEQ